MGYGPAVTKSQTWLKPLSTMLEWVDISQDLQGIYPIQGSNLCRWCLLPWQADSLPLHHLGSQGILLWSAMWYGYHYAISLHVPICHPCIFFGELTLMLFLHFLTRVFVFSLLSHQIWVLCQICGLQIFFFSDSNLSFHLLNSCFHRVKDLILMKLRLIHTPWNSPLRSVQLIDSFVHSQGTVNILTTKSRIFSTLRKETPSLLVFTP